MEGIQLTKGHITKNKIYRCAKRSFYDVGYNKTTITKISKELGIGLGNITYYFKTKDSIATQIWKDFLKSIYTCIDPYLEDNCGFFFRYYVHIFVYYNVIMSDPHRKRFFAEIQAQQASYKVIPPAVEFAYEEFIKEFNLRLTPFQCSVLKYADLGARREVMLKYLDEELEMPVNDLAITVTTNMCKLWGIPDEIIYRTGYNALETFKRIDYSEIDFLK